MNEAFSWKLIQCVCIPFTLIMLIGLSCICIVIIFELISTLRKGDYLRYEAEFASGQQRKDVAEKSLVAYKAANEIATKDLTPTDPIRLGNSFVLLSVIPQWDQELKFSISETGSVHFLFIGKFKMQNWLFLVWQIKRCIYAYAATMTINILSFILLHDFKPRWNFCDMWWPTLKIAANYV